MSVVMVGMGFDTVTDWIGVPLVVLLLVALFAIDRRSVRNLLTDKWLYVGTGLVMVLAVGLIAARFIVLA